MGWLGLLFFSAVCAFWASFGIWLFLRLPAGPAAKPVQVDIEAGMSAPAIADRLHAEGVVSDPQAFYWLCRFRAAANRIQAGEYLFSAPMTPDQVIEKLVQGRVLLHRITLPEGSTVRDVAGLLERAGLAREAEIAALARDPAFIRSLGLELSSLEGYLFPETYHYPRNQNPRIILKSMVRQFRERFSEAMVRRAGEKGLSVHEVVILASMVEKEAAVDEERSLVAAVFLNRLRRNMPLQSDPTAVYDLEGFSGPVLAAHLKRDSPYNTYRVRGLPVGPICNPGIRSLEAVLHPADVPYLYFVSNLDGTHRFSTTLSEHQEAVSRFREKSRNERENDGSTQERNGGNADGPEGDRGPPPRHKASP